MLTLDKFPNEPLKSIFTIPGVVDCANNESPIPIDVTFSKVLTPSTTERPAAPSRASILEFTPASKLAELIDGVTVVISLDTSVIKEISPELANVIPSTIIPCTLKSVLPPSPPITTGTVPRSTVIT